MRRAWPFSNIRLSPLWRKLVNTATGRFTLLSKEMFLILVHKCTTMNS
jgi:hypothetical protein